MAYTSTLLGDVSTILADINSALAGPKFDSSYNTDPGMPAAKMAFESARDDVLTGHTTISNTISTLASSYYSTTSGYQSPEGIRQDAGWWNNHPFASFADRVSNIDGLKAQAASCKSVVRGFADYASYAQSDAAALKTTAETLLTDINNY
jgi:hypothetical protein